MTHVELNIDRFVGAVYGPLESQKKYEKDDKDASKPVDGHFNLPNHSKEHMFLCDLSLHQGTTYSG